MMKITPLEIRQKTFEKIFRGYDKDEVTSFLSFLSQEWEKMSDEKRLLQMKLEQSEKESEKLRQVEDSLFKTLKSAEDTGASMIEQANKTAELIIKEARMNAKALQVDSEKQAQNRVESANAQAKSVMEDLREDVAALVESYETLLAQREIVLKNLKNLAGETLETVNMAKEELKRIDVTAHAKVIKELNRQGSYSAVSERVFKDHKQTIVTEINPEPVSEQEQQDEKEVAAKIPAPAPLAEERQEDPPVEATPMPAEKTKQHKPGSFFDQFD